MMKDKFQYQSALIGACEVLVKCRNDVFTAMINVAMTGEYHDIDALFETGEVVEFELAHFENAEDINLQHLFQVIQKLESSHDSLINLNRLDEE